jgi:hypothetical protein
MICGLSCDAKRRHLEFGMGMVVQKVAFSPSPSTHDYAAAT